MNLRKWDKLEDFKYGCRMCSFRFKYINLMWKHVNEAGHQVSNENYYSNNKTGPPPKPSNNTSSSTF